MGIKLKKDEKPTIKEIFLDWVASVSRIYNKTDRVKFLACLGIAVCIVIFMEKPRKEKIVHVNQKGDEVVVIKSAGEASKEQTIIRKYHLDSVYQARRVVSLKEIGKMIEDQVNSGKKSKCIILEKNERILDQDVNTLKERGYYVNFSESFGEWFISWK